MINRIPPLASLRRLLSIPGQKGGIESGPALAKWIVLGGAIGLVAGLGAIVFYWAIDFSTNLFLGTLAGYYPPHPSGEGTTVVSAVLHPFMLPLVVALGGLISGIIVFNTAPEAEGHGTDAAIASFHYKGGKVRKRVPLIKLVASAITIGSGGSGGREGPAAQISAGFGSTLAGWLHLDTQSRRIALATGMGAGIGSIFRAPLGGAVMAAEILYKHDLEAEALIPALIASIVGYTVYGAVYGFGPIFGNQASLLFDSPVQLLYYTVLGVICGLVGILYARTFAYTSHLFHQLRLPNWAKPAIGGLLVGTIGIVVPQALHMGYGWVQVTMSSAGLLGLPLWVVLILPFVKIVTTSLSIGSGGSGGIFGPGMVIGALLGATCWRLAEGILPNMPASPAPFVIVAMMALFGGIAHAPLAVMLMVAEMTGNLTLLAPAMLAVSISTLICGDNTIYINQVDTRVDSPAHRYRFSFPLLASLRVGDVISDQPLRFSPTLSARAAMATLVENDASGAPVVDESGTLLGVVTRADIAASLAGAEATVGAVMTHDPVTIETDDTLDTALEQIASHRISWLPVLAADGTNQLSGVLTTADVSRAYRQSMNQGARRLGGVISGGALLEVKISGDSPVVGKALRELNFPMDSLVVSVRRGGELIFPRGDTELQSGDMVMALTSPISEEELRHYLTGLYRFVSS